jgi:hypothetical protein
VDDALLEVRLRPSRADAVHDLPAWRTRCAVELVAGTDLLATMNIVRVPANSRG